MEPCDELWRGLREKKGVWVATRSKPGGQRIRGERGMATLTTSGCIFPCEAISGLVNGRGLSTFQRGHNTSFCMQRCLPRRVVCILVIRHWKGVIGSSCKKEKCVMEYVVVKGLKEIENRDESRCRGGSRKASCGNLRFPSWVTDTVEHLPPSYDASVSIGHVVTSAPCVLSYCGSFRSWSCCV